MIIRAIKKKDITEVAELFNLYRIFYSKESNISEAKSFLLERFKNNDSKIYVCEGNNGKLLGFVQMYPLFSSTRMKKYWVLNDLFVSNQYRGKGISVKLIERAKTLVKTSSACGMYLETEKTNKIGNKLYQKTGLTLNDNSNFYEWDI